MAKPVWLADRPAGAALPAGERRGYGAATACVVSAVERKPAQLVAQPLVVEHKFSDLMGELGALPLALQTAGLHAFVFSHCRARGLDRVGCGSEFVRRDMAYRRGLAGSVRGMPCRPAQVSGRGICVSGRCAGLPPLDLIPRPGTPEVDRPAWTVVRRPLLLEVVQHVLRAVSRPHREETMIVVLEDPAATHGDEPRIPDLGEDHQFESRPRPSRSQPGGKGGIRTPGGT
jgi:hypothetical protein